MDECGKCGGLGIICTSTSSCLDISCADCGKIKPCPVCSKKPRIVERPAKVLQLKRKEE